MLIQDMLTEKRLHQLDGMVAEIMPAELNKKLEAGEIFEVIEISEPHDFEQAHIDGALNFQIESVVETALRRFEKFEQIVLYASKAASGVASVAAKRLQRAGFTNVLVLRGGKEAWEKEGLPLVGRNEAAAA